MSTLIPVCSVLARFFFARVASPQFRKHKNLRVLFSFPRVPSEFQQLYHPPYIVHVPPRAMRKPSAGLLFSGRSRSNEKSNQQFSSLIKSRRFGRKLLDLGSELGTPEEDTYMYAAFICQFYSAVMKIKALVSTSST